MIVIVSMLYDVAAHLRCFRGEELTFRYSCRNELYKMQSRQFEQVQYTTNESEDLVPRESKNLFQICVLRIYFGGGSYSF